jgi:hypothetical protein
MQGLGIRGFGSKFEIRIALLWEAAATTYCLDITADNDRQVIRFGDEYHREVISALQAFQPLVSASSTDHIGSDEWLDMEALMLANRKQVSR